ncbi:MAG TPA: efflux RND transporter periplasmic adaptor subunit, partial [Gemmatales bacterium]|nr:efflux RND transporter periplasmic adaptor subunit [Gemmatales bacterium]
TQQLVFWGVVLGVGFATWRLLAHRSGPVSTATATASQPAPVSVTVAQVTPRPIQRVVNLVGSLWGKEEISVAPKVEGRVKRILHDMGDVVRPGDLLLEIEETEFQLAVEEAQRALDLELSKLGLRTPPAPDFNIEELPSVRRTEALMKNASSVRERYRKLPELARTEEERERIETEYSVAIANHQQTLLEAQSTLASVQYRQALLATAKQKLAETKVYVPAPQFASETTVPVEFVVAQRSISTGEMVRLQGNTGTTLFRLVIADELKLQAAIPERHLGEIKTGQRVQVRVEAFPAEVFEGKVSRVNRTVDRASRTFTVEVALPNKDRRLSAGSFAKASIIVDEHAEAMTVPEEAVLNFAGVVKVFTIVDGKAQGIPVKTGEQRRVEEAPFSRTWVEITGPVHAGMPIITSGFQQLSDQIPVVIRQQ